MDTVQLHDLYNHIEHIRRTAEASRLDAYQRRLAAEFEEWSPEELAWALASLIKKEIAMTPEFRVLQEAADFIAYLLSHLPDEACDNRVWVRCNTVLTGKACEACGSTGSQYEWCENIAVGLSDCPKCEGLGKVCPAIPAAEGNGR